MPHDNQKARIYRTPKSAMQSGRGRTDDWVLHYEPLEPKRIDPLKGWSGSGDTNSQVRLASRGGGVRLQFDDRVQLDLEAVRRLTRNPDGVGTQKLDAQAVYARVLVRF